MSTERHNRTAWDGRMAGHLESWQVGFSDRPAGMGYLIRYGLEAPLPGAGGPVAQLAFARFDAEKPSANLALVRQVPLEQAGLGKVGDDVPWQVALAGGTVSHDALSGEIVTAGHTARWDLRFQPAVQPHVYLPQAAYGGRRLWSMKLVAPNPAIHVTGQVEIDGQEVQVDGAPGCQMHAWGRDHLPAWALGYCNAFREDATAALQVLSLQPRAGRLFEALPRVTPVAVYLGGEVYDFCSWPEIVFSRGRWETGTLRFAATGHHVKLKGELRARPEDLFRAKLGDPGGKPVYCHATEVADAVVTIWTRRSRLSRFRQLCRLTSRSAAHLEHGGQDPDPLIDRPYELAPPSSRG